MKRLQAIVWVLLGLATTGFSQSSMWDKSVLSSRAVIDSLEFQIPVLEGEQKLECLNRLAEAYWELNPDQTISYASEALKMARALKNRKQEGHALLNLCQGYLFNDLYDKAFDYGLKSLEVREEVGDQLDIAFTLRTLGWLYYDIGFYDNAIEYHRKVLALHEAMNDEERIAYSYNSLGLIYAKKNDHTTALSFYRKSLELKLPFRNTERISESLKNLGISYAAIGNYDLAVANLLKSLELIHQTRDHYDWVEVLNELGDIYIKNEKHDSAAVYLGEARVMIEGISDNKDLMLENFLITSKLYSQQGDFENALLYHARYDSIKEEIISEEKRYKLAEMRILYEAERRENEIKLLQQEKENERFKQKALLVGMVLLLVIGVLIVNRLVSGIRKNKKIFEANQHLIEAKLKNEELATGRLKDKLDYRKKELTSLALFIAQRNETYQDLSRSLKNFDFLDRDDANNKIKRLVADYERKLKINEDIDEFYSDVENLNDDFFFRLREKFPRLTDNDMKLAAQLRMNLSSKEISSLNNISVKSVEISRYRLRKKLNLEASDILTDYLKSV
ncbi:MAG: tetratricopeptide repeat protein [Cyclobacteriaceae bacterium]